MALLLIAALLFAPVIARAGTPSAAGPPVRAAYCYDYMPATHLDTLAAMGFGRAVVHTIADSAGAAERKQWTRWLARAEATGVEVVPEWMAHARTRLEGERRYAWTGGGDDVMPCPMDSLAWRLALIDRTAEVADLKPSPRRVAVDLEMNRASRTHWNAGPCRCTACIAEFVAAREPQAPEAPRPPRGAANASATHWRGRFAAVRDDELQAFQERRLTVLLARLLGEFARRFPGVELGVLDLDRDLYPHRALARALARTGVPTADYSECSYAEGGEPLVAARARLNRLGLRKAPLYGGLWLQRVPPDQIAAAIRSIRSHADGYFVFTTYSLWQEPARLAGPYTLRAPAARYAEALAGSSTP